MVVYLGCWSSSLLLHFRKNAIAAIIATDAASIKTTGIRVYATTISELVELPSIGSALICKYEYFTTLWSYSSIASPRQAMYMSLE